MSDYGVTPEGWSSKRLLDILQESEENLSTIEDLQTGNKLNPNFNSDDPAMQIVKVPLNQTSLAWEATKLAYDQYNPSNAVGPSLDAIGQVTGISRLPATAAVIEIELTGTIGATIPAGQTISDQFDTLFFTTDEEVIFSSTTETSTATATITGPQIISTGQIDKIVTPVAGWDSVTNTGQLTLGTNEETDEAFEARRQLSNAAPSAAPADSVYANLANIEGVEYARVYINNSLATDSRGIPAKNQSVVIQGGDDTEIAKTILARSGATAEFFGSTTVTLYDLQGEPTPVSFSRPIPVPMTVIVDITVTNATLFPTDGPELIKDNIILYAQSGADALGTTSGFNEDGFPPGVNVTVSRLYTPVNAVPGHQINALTVNGVTTEVPINFNEVAEFTDANITVTVS